MELQNKPWNLEYFVDALVMELDKTRETLAVKSINKPLSYTVKDMALDLQIFPTYDGDEVKFVTARPGEQGASKVTIKLDSITDQVVRATTKKLPSRSDTNLDSVEIDHDTKKELKKIGVKTVNDLEELEKKNIDIEKVSTRKIDYRNLANMIQKLRREKTPPVVNRVSLGKENNKQVIMIEGRNLAVQKDFLPVAVLNDQAVEVLSYDKKEMKLDVSASDLSRSQSELIIALDPYSIFKVKLKTNTL